MARADHIKVSRGFYDHHGIDCGNGWVIHYDGEPFAQEAACVKIDTIETFSQGTPVKVVSYDEADSSDEVMERANGRLGEERYNLFFNNCEHFAAWCKTGRGYSKQVFENTIKFAAQVAKPALAKEVSKRLGAKIGGEATKSLGRSSLRGNVVTGLIVGAGEQLYDTARWVNGELDNEDFRRNTVGNVCSTSGAIGGAAIGTLILPGVGTAIGGFVGGLLGQFGGKKLGS